MNHLPLLSLYAEPKALKQRVVALKKRYLDQNEKVHVCDDSKSMFKSEINILKAKLAASERIHLMDQKRVKTMQERLIEWLLSSVSHNANTFRAE